MSAKSRRPRKVGRVGGMRETNNIYRILLGNMFGNVHFEDREGGGRIRLGIA
jgi:hypothetical protein